MEGGYEALSKILDERVVSMQFDNKNFEKNVSQSMSTLDKLKQKLNFDRSSKGLEDVGKAAGLCSKSIADTGSSADEVKSHFSAMEVVGVTALMNITNSAVNAGKNLIRSLTVAPISDGFKEYEMTLNAIQTTMAGTGKTADEVQEQLKRLDKYADDTVYSSADMLNNLPKFTNAGVELTKATTAMIGIANATALAGGDASKASIAFYNLGQSISTGYLSRVDYNSINNAGIATMEWKNHMVEAAIAEGKLKKAGDDLYETNGKQFTLQSLFIDGLQEQWASTNVLMDVFEDYGNTETEIGNKAQHAAQDLRTFSQMMESVKAQAGTGWKDTWQLIFGDLDQAKVLWTAVGGTISGVIGEMSKARNNFISGVLTSKWSQVSDKLSEAGVDVNAFKQQLIDAGKASGAITEDMAVDVNTFEKSLSKGWLTNKNFIKELKNYKGTASVASSATEDMTAKLAEFQGIVDSVYQGSYKNGEDRIKALTEAGYDYNKVQGLVNKTVDGHRITLEDLNESQLENIGCTQEQIAAYKTLQEQAKAAGIPLEELMEELTRPSGRELIIESVSHSAENLAKVFKSLRKAFSDVFNLSDATDGMYSFIKILHDINMQIEFTDEEATNLRNTFKGLFTILKWLSSIINAGIMIPLRILNGVLGEFDLNLLSVTGTAGEAIYKFDQWAKVSEIIGKVIDVVSKAIANLIKKIGFLFDKLESIPIVKATIDKLSASIADFFENSDKYFEEGKKKVEGWIQSFEKIPYVGNIVDGVKTFFEDAGESFDAFIERAKKLDGVSLKNIGKMFDDFHQNVTGKMFSFDKASSAFSSGWKNIVGIIETLTGKRKDVNNNRKTTTDVCDDVRLAAGKVEPASTTIGTSADNMRTSLEKFVTFVEDRLSNINLGEVLALAFGTTFIVAATKTFKIADSLSGFLDKVGGVVGAIKKVFTSMSIAIEKNSKRLGKAVLNMSKAAKFKAIGQMIWDMAKAFALIAGAVFVLSKLDSNGVFQAMGVLTTVTAALVLLVATLSKYPVKDTIKVTGIMLAMSVSVAILAKAVSTLSNIPWQKALGAIVGVGIILAELVAATVIIGTFSRKTSKGAGILLALSVSMLILSLALKNIADIPVTNAIVAVDLIKQLMITMAKALFIIGLVGTAAKKGAGAILAMTFAMVLLTVVIKIVAKFTPKQIVAAIAVMTAMIVFIGVMSIAMKKIGEDGKYIGKAGLALIGMAVAMTAMAIVIKMVAKMSVEDLAKGCLVISTFAIACGLLIKLGKTDNSGKASLGAAAVISAFGLAMISLSVALFILSNLPLGGLAVGTIVISVIMVMMTNLIKATKHATNASKTIIAISIVFASLAASLAIISLLDPKKALLGTACITVILGMVNLIIQSTKNSKDAMKSLIVIAAIIAELGIVIGVLSAVSPDNAIIIAGSISVLLLSLAGAFAIISKSGSSITKETVALLAVMAVTVAALGAIIGLLGNLFPMTNAMVIAGSVSILLLALAVAFAIISKTGKDVSPATVVLMGLITTVILAMGAMIGVLSGMNMDQALVVAGSIGILLLSLAGAFAILAKIDGVGIATNMVALSVGLAAFGAALLILAPGLLMLSTMSLPELAITLIALAGALAIIGIAATLLTPAIIPLLALGAATALIGVGVLTAGIGINFLAQAIMTLSSIPIPAIVAAVLTIVAVLTAFGIAGLLLAPITPILLLLGAAVALFGVGCLNIAMAVKTITELFIFFAASTKDGSGTISQALQNIYDFFSNIFSNIGSILSNAASVFKEQAGQIASGILNAIKDGLSPLKDVVGNMIDQAIDAVGGKIGEWKNIGVNIAEGLKEGIEKAAYKVVDAAKNVVKKAADSVKNFLGIASPSKLYKSFGKYSDLGLAQGLIQFAGVVKNASTKVAKTAVDSMTDSIATINDIVNSNMDANPTIRPVLDLSSVQSGTSMISSMLNRNQALSIGASINAQEVSRSENSQNGPTTAASGNSFQFTQNNYSPKALSRSEIYRQTKNQFAQVEGLVNS